MERRRTPSARPDQRLCTGPEEHRRWRRAVALDVDLVHTERLKNLDGAGLGALDKLQARCIVLDQILQLRRPSPPHATSVVKWDRSIDSETVRTSRTVCARRTARTAVVRGGGGETTVLRAGNRSGDQPGAPALSADLPGVAAPAAMIRCCTGTGLRWCPITSRGR